MSIHPHFASRVALELSTRSMQFASASLSLRVLARGSHRRSSSDGDGSLHLRLGFVEEAFEICLDLEKPQALGLRTARCGEGLLGRLNLGHAHRRRR